MSEIETNHLEAIDAAITTQTAVIQEAAELATPHGRARRHWTAATRRVHPTQVGKVVGLISEYTEKIERLSREGQEEAALREVDRCTDAIRYSGAYEAKREPLQQDIWKGRLEQFGWAPEIGALFNDQGGLVRPGQKIDYLDWWVISVNGVEHMHEKIRARAGMSRLPIVTRGEVERQAAVDPAIKEMLRRIDAQRK